MERKSNVTLEPLGTILHFSIPHLQRGLDEAHIDAMVADQQQEFARHGCFSMLQSITVGMYEKNIFVLDGQHRIKAYQRLGQMGFPIQNVILPVVVYHVASTEELVYYYNRINKHMPIHPFETESAWMNYGKEFLKMFTDAFEPYTKGKGKARCPNISLEALKTNLSARNIDKILRERNMTLPQLWQRVLEVNTGIKTHLASDAKKITSCEGKASIPCYLSILKNFEWLDIALSLNSIEYMLTSITSKKRKPIPAAIRQEVWRKHHANICDAGQCFVCENALNYPDMECGHILAHALGGSDDIANLLPICKTCNRDMGIMNLHEYKKMFTSQMQLD